MFKVNEYKIVFKRVWHWYPVSKGSREGLVRRSGRYDTKCEIYVHQPGAEKTEGKPRFIGIAKLHPNDQPDKIIGKKIALRNAIGVWDAESEEWSYSCSEFFNKEVRSTIWTHFWAWVADWPNQKSNRQLHNTTPKTERR